MTEFEGERSPKFKIGEHVASWNSGLVYVVQTIHELDLTGECFGYTVRRLRGGVEYGPRRLLGENSLISEKRKPIPHDRYAV